MEPKWGTALASKLSLCWKSVTGLTNLEKKLVKLQKNTTYMTSQIDDFFSDVHARDKKVTA